MASKKVKLHPVQNEGNSDRTWWQRLKDFVSYNPVNVASIQQDSHAITLLNEIDAREDRIINVFHLQTKSSVMELGGVLCEDEEVASTILPPAVKLSEEYKWCSQPDVKQQLEANLIKEGCVSVGTYNPCPNLDTLEQAALKLQQFDSAIATAVEGGEQYQDAYLRIKSELDISSWI